MAVTNTGGSRNQSVTIKTFVNGGQTSSEKYWITQGNYTYLGNPVSEEDLQILPEGDHQAPVSGTYAHLLVDFQSWVESFFTSLDVSAVQTNEPYDETNGFCPVTTGGGGGGDPT